VTDSGATRSWHRSARAGFEREAKATAALSHPNVLTVFDVGHEDGRTYLVFEMLDGSTLAQVMKKGGLRTREALDYAGQVARGLAAAHSHGVVHRDVKPANLFLTTTGIVKILDFGLARIRGAGSESHEETTTEVTGPGLVLGTVSYMSPEQARGEPLDARSDLFALGTVLYEMLSGRHPFRRIPRRKRRARSSGMRRSTWAGSSARPRGRSSGWWAAAGGAEERITHEGGTVPYESIDGRTLYFLRRLGAEAGPGRPEGVPLLSLPVGGGTERQIVACTYSFAVGPGGVYYMECSSAETPEASLVLWDSATGRDRALGKVSGVVGLAALAVSPDGRTILYSKQVGSGNDLMLIENFR